MNINEAFSTRAIEGFLLTEEESDELRGVVGEYLQDGQMDTPGIVNLAEVCFQAGRSYQASLGFLVPMSPGELGDFIEYLRSRT